jgi:uroporphyrinogen decarboxylase
MFDTPVVPNWEGLLRCLRREGSPDRVYFAELSLDEEVKTAVARRFNLMNGLSVDDPFSMLEREIRVQRFLGYDYVRCSMDEMGIEIDRLRATDTAELARSGGREYIDEHRGPITTWAEFDTYSWPDPNELTTRSFEWFQENLPDDMCIVAGGKLGHFAEYLSWLMGYETLCYSLFDQRDLVAAISDRLMAFYEVVVRRMLQFDRVKVVWPSDDMGFRTGTLISPADLRRFVLPGHRQLAAITHAAGRPYLLHSCGKLDAIMDDLVNDVKIDGLHSFEDAIRTVEDTKAKYGHRIAVLGGLDVDFLCRADEAAVRGRTRRTLEACHPGGGYCLGTGNSVANYLPLDNYLAMLDEGRRFGGNGHAK